MVVTLNTPNTGSAAILDMDANKTPTSNQDANKTPRSSQDANGVTIIQMGGGDTIEVQMSTDGAQAIAALSASITVTFHNVSKVISVPAKMIDPTSNERFIERILLDKVSGQIHPGQLVALMGPSGN
jgi:hypothetical protein